jgi:hypothetical protein
MRTIGYKVPIRAEDGTIKGYKDKIVSLVSKKELDGTFCRDHGKRLVISLKNEDLIEFRVFNSQKRYDISIFDLFKYTVRRYAANAVLEKARNKKKTIQLKREISRIKRAEKKLFKNHED